MRGRRWRLAAGLALALLLPAPAFAMSCSEAAAVAEAGESIPAGLLLAIGGVESGRSDLVGGRAPWPWTIQAGGIGRFFDGAEAAQDAVRALQAGGTQSIDVGCFQVNLMYHPEAFADLVQAFDPLGNALAAARFLASLHDELGSWERAVAAYHSREDRLGLPYLDQVFASWHGTPAPARFTAAAWSAAWSAAPVVVMAGVRVWGPPGVAEVPGSGVSRAAAMPRAAARTGLPRVITPGGG